MFHLFNPFKEPHFQLYSLPFSADVAFCSPDIIICFDNELSLSCIKSKQWISPFRFLIIAVQLQVLPLFNLLVKEGSIIWNIEVLLMFCRIGKSI